MKTTEIYGDKIILRFGGTNFPKILGWIKSFVNEKGRYIAQFNYTEKYWTVPNTLEWRARLQSAGWQPKGATGDAYIAQKGLAPEELMYHFGEFSHQKININKELLNPKIRPFQIEAIQFVIHKKNKAIISLPMGSGKSAIASSWVSVARAEGMLKDKPVLVICPAGLRSQWCSELKKWAGLKAIPLYGKNPNQKIKNNVPCYVVGQDIVFFWSAELIGKFSTVIVDECQNFSSMTAKRSMAMRKIAESCENTIFLSGTPIRNRPIEFFNVLNLVAPQYFNDLEYYRHRYCGPDMGWGGKLEYKGATHLDELHDRVKRLMFRKSMAEILPELPQKSRNMYKIEIDKDSEFWKQQEELQTDMEEGNLTDAAMKEKLKALSHTAYYLKRTAMFEMIDEFLGESETEKIVLVGYHHDVMDDLQNKYKDICVKIDGRTTGDRLAIVEQFNNDPKVRVMVAQMQAAGVGFSMTGASNMAFCELWYVPTDIDQMESRILRLTSTADHANYFFFVGANTVEERMVTALNEKTENLSTILDGTGVSYFTDADLRKTIFL